MEIRFYWNMIKRGWWLIAISMLVALNASLIISYFFTTPMYEAESRIIVSPNVEAFANEDDLVNSLEALDKRSIVQTYAEVINSTQIFDNTLTLLQANAADYAMYTRSVVVIPDANIVQLFVQGPDPETTAVLANAIGQNGIDYINDLYKIYDIRFIDTASVPVEPFKPRPVQDSILALVIGGIIGVGLAITKEQLSGTIESIRLRRMIDSESMAFSREHFERVLRNELLKEPYQTLSVGIMSLSDIEGLADVISQPFVNSMFRDVVNFLKHELRGNDIVARYSQYQFSILLPATPGKAAKQTLGRIRNLIAKKQVNFGGVETVHIEPVVGVTSSVGPTDSLNAIMERAEQALENAMQSDDHIHLHKVDPFV